MSNKGIIAIHARVLFLILFQVYNMRKGALCLVFFLKIKHLKVFK